MMREFHAETDRHQTTVENNVTTLINATADHGNLAVTANDQSTAILRSDNNLNQPKINMNTSESRTFIERNRLNIKSANRLTCDTLAVRSCFIFKVSYLLYSRHQDVRHMICMV